jgi:hypothetical protein
LNSDIGPWNLTGAPTDNYGRFIEVEELKTEDCEPYGYGRSSSDEERGIDELKNALNAFMLPGGPDRPRDLTVDTPLNTQTGETPLNTQTEDYP